MFFIIEKALNYFNESTLMDINESPILFRFPIIFSFILKSDKWFSVRVSNSCFNWSQFVVSSHKRYSKWSLSSPQFHRKLGCSITTYFSIISSLGLSLWDIGEKLPVPLQRSFAYSYASAPTYTSVFLLPSVYKRGSDSCTMCIC